MTKIVLFPFFVLQEFSQFHLGGVVGLFAQFPPNTPVECSELSQGGQSHQGMQKSGWFRMCCGQKQPSLLTGPLWSCLLLLCPLNYLHASFCTGNSRVLSITFSLLIPDFNSSLLHHLGSAPHLLLFGLLLSKFVQSSFVLVEHIFQKLPEKGFLFFFQEDLIAYQFLSLPDLQPSTEKGFLNGKISVL